MKSLVIQVNIKPEGKTPNGPQTFWYKKELYEASNRSVKEWAERYGHEYLLIEEQTYSHPAFERFRIFTEDFDRWDQIMYCDSDFFFHATTPDLLAFTQQRQEKIFLTQNTTTENNNHAKNRQRCETQTYYNSGMMVWKKEGRLLVRQSIEEALHKYKYSPLKDQDAINWMLRDKHHHILKLGRDWNDAMAHVRPLFSTHWCGRGKERWNPEHQRKIDLKKMSRMSELSEQLLDLYVQQTKQTQTLF